MVTPTPDLSSRICAQEWTCPLRLEAWEHPPFVHKYGRPVSELAYSTPMLSSGMFRLRPHQVCSFTVKFCSSRPSSTGDPLRGPVLNEPTFAFLSGQIVCCQADVRTTLGRVQRPSGRSLILARSESLIRQMGYSSVLSVEMDKRINLWTIKVFCIGREALPSTHPNVIPISSLFAEGSVTPSPAWPLSDSYCYIFPRPMKFFCYPGEVQPVASPWMLSTADIDLLRQKSTATPLHKHCRDPKA
jgi:hypothetical protein